MLSIISCTTDTVKTDLLYNNICETIGLEFEFLPFDNSQKRLGLCEVYNSQAKIATGKILCFIHDDIRFVTQDWGIQLKRLFESDETIGLVGVAGACHKTACPSMWMAAPANMLASNIIQHHKYTVQETYHLYNKFTEEKETDVVVVDGVFMATRAMIANEMKFDQHLLLGFHGYDTDYSLQVGEKYRVLVTFEILLEHFSEGNLGIDWLNSSKLISRKWKHLLPINIFELSKIEQDRLEYAAMFVVFKILRQSGNATPFRMLFFLLSSFRWSFFIIPFIKKKIDKRLASLRPI